MHVSFLIFIEKYLSETVQCFQIIVKEEKPDQSSLSSSCRYFPVQTACSVHSTISIVND